MRINGVEPLNQVTAILSIACFRLRRVVGDAIADLRFSEEVEAEMSEQSLFRRSAPYKPYSRAKKYHTSLLFFILEPFIIFFVLTISNGLGIMFWVWIRSLLTQRKA